MKKQDRLDCFSKQQRKIYEMYQSGMKRKDIAKALNLNYISIFTMLKYGYSNMTARKMS